MYSQKIVNCIDLQVPVKIFKNHAFRTCSTPYRTFRPVLRSLGLLDIKLPRKENISTDGQSDEQTDGRTGVANSDLLVVTLLSG